MQDYRQSNRCATWIECPPIKSVRVRFTPTALDELRLFSCHSEDPRYRLRHLQNPGELKEAIQDILLADPRSTYRRRKCDDKLYFFTVDTAHVTSWFDDSSAEVLRVKSVTEVGDFGQKEWIRQKHTSLWHLSLCNHCAALGVMRIRLGSFDTSECRRNLAGETYAARELMWIVLFCLGRTESVSGPFCRHHDEFHTVSWDSHLWVSQGHHGEKTAVTNRNKEPSHKFIELTRNENVHGWNDDMMSLVLFTLFCGLRRRWRRCVFGLWYLVDVMKCHHGENKTEKRIFFETLCQMHFCYVEVILIGNLWNVKRTKSSHTLCAPVLKRTTPLPGRPQLKQRWVPAFIATAFLSIQWWAMAKNNNTCHRSSYHRIFLAN